MANFNAAQFNFKTSADAIAIATALGAGEGAHGNGEFRVCLLAAQIGARKAAIATNEKQIETMSVGHVLFFAYAKAKNDAARKAAGNAKMTLVDTSNKDLVKNKASLFNRFWRTGFANGENTLACIDAIIGKLNSKGASGYSVPKISSALQHIEKGRVALSKVEALEKGGSKPKPKAEAKPATFDETVAALVTHLKAAQTAYPDRATFFAGVIKYIEQNKSAEPAKAKKKNTAQAPVANATNI